MAEPTAVAGSRSGRPVGARPLVVIPARFSTSAAALRYRAEVAAAALVEAVHQAGGEALVVHPEAPAGLDEAGMDALVRERLWLADGVVLPGGGDLAAHWAGQDPHETQYDVDEEQDAFDLAVARVALQDAIPLLSICRGTQVVNVARGGDLVQDMTESLGGDHRHLVHEVDVVAETPLRDLAAGETMTISCYHHQGISRLGKALKASAFAGDGTIEAVTTDAAHGWYLGVQWHPEDTAASDPRQAGIFAALVDAARGS